MAKYHEGAAFGIFILFAIVVCIMATAQLLPAMLWYFVIMVAVVAILSTVYRCVTKQATSSLSRQPSITSITTISDGRDGLIHDNGSQSSGSIAKKDLPPKYEVAVKLEQPPPPYSMLAKSMKTPIVKPPAII